MPALLDVDRPEIGLDLLDASGAGFERRDVPFVDGDVGLGFELLRRLVVAAIIRGDLVSGCLERFGDCRADTACSPAHQRVAWHVYPPVCLALALPELSEQLKDADGRDKTVNQLMG
jgi:hypothetical protein